MKLKILVDNNTIIDRYFYAEPGVSYLIEDEDTKILFDTGYSDIFIKNAKKMNEKLLDVDYIVISHGHIDHTWGLVPLIRLYTEAQIENIDNNKSTLIAHPDTFLYKEIEGIEEIGSVLDAEKLAKHFTMNLSKEPIWITDKMVFLGEIERNNNFENQEPIGQYELNGVKIDDYVIDDSAIVYKTNEGLVIITGCSHAGVCNITEYAKKVCKDNRIVDIIGGFHLLDPSIEQMNKTIEYFAQSDIKKIHACHCTDLKSKIELSKVTDIQEVGVGLVLEYK